MRHFRKIRYFHKVNRSFWTEVALLLSSRTFLQQLTVCFEGEVLNRDTRFQSKKRKRTVLFWESQWFPKPLAFTSYWLQQTVLCSVRNTPTRQTPDQFTRLPGNPLQVWFLLFCGSFSDYRYCLKNVLWTDRRRKPLQSVQWSNENERTWFVVDKNKTKPRFDFESEHAFVL